MPSSCVQPGIAQTAAVITGMGIVSTIGTTLDEVSASLRAGRSGIVLEDARREMGFRSCLTGRISGFDAARYGLTLKMQRTMAEAARYAYAAGVDAIADAGLGESDIRSHRCGLIFGNDSTIAASMEAMDICRQGGSTHMIGAGRMFQTMCSTVTMNLAAVLGIRGVSYTVSAACASGAHALGHAMMLIRSGMQDVVIAGGAQELAWPMAAVFDALGACSTRHAEPEQASRPFDAERDGLVPSGGGACLVIESYRRALARGARIYGVLRGFGMTTDGDSHLSRPTGEGAIRAMRMALADAAIEPGQVDYVNAHATSTPAGDAAEAGAIAAVLGSSVPVSSTKSMTGHECWMAGASEVVYTTLMARDGFIAPNLNFVRQDEQAARVNIVNGTIERPIGMAVSNSFGFGGNNAVLVLDFAGSGQR